MARAVLNFIPSYSSYNFKTKVENEYGSYYKCDRDYVAFLAHKIQQELGIDILLFTTDGDGDNYLNCGTTLGAYATVDFGPGIIKLE